MSFALQLHSYPRPSARFKYTHIYTHIHVYRNVLKPPKVLASAARVILLQSAARSPLRTSQQKRTQCMVHTYTNDFFQVHWGNAKRNQRDFLGCTGKFPDPADPGGHRGVVLLAVGKASNAIRILLMLSAYAFFVCTLYEARTTSHCLKFVSQSRHADGLHHPRPTPQSGFFQRPKSFTLHIKDLQCFKNKTFSEKEV